ncbi:MAG: phage head closure protein [Alphaproteobacteria bacterium]
MNGAITNSIGAMRARVVIQRENPVATGGGGYAPGWSDVASLWAQMEPLSGREVLQGARLEARVTHRAIVRYRADITAGMRLVYGTRLFRIHAALNLEERNHFIQLLLEEGGAV